MKTDALNLRFLFVVIGLTAYASPVYAYLDPGTGSILLQGLIGGIATAVSFLSIYWHKVKAFFVKEEDTDKIDKDQPFIYEKNPKQKK